MAENRILPDWVYEVDASVLIAFSENPARFIRKRVVSFIVGVVASLTTATGSIGREVLGSVSDAVRDAGDAVGGAVGSVVFPIVDAWIGFNVGFGNVAADVLGPAAPIAVVGLVIVQVALVLRAIPPALVALSDFLSAVPVLGSVLNALATFAIEYIGGTDS